MNEWGSPWREEQEAKKSKRKIVLILIIASIVTLFSITFLIFLRPIFFPVNTAIQSINIAYDVVDEVMDKDKAIYNYEWFKEQEAYIRQCLTNEEIAKEEWELFKSELPDDREKWDRDDKQEEGSLRNSYYALQKLTNKAIEDYNAKASMVTRNVFKDNLPSNIDRAYYAGIQLTK